MAQLIHIAGGGLAGTEAAWQIARRGLRVALWEMRPARRTPAHQTGRLAELVCSNSLKSESDSTAPWLLKEELRRLDSLLLTAASLSILGNRLWVMYHLGATLTTPTAATESSAIR